MRTLEPKLEKHIDLLISRYFAFREEHDLSIYCCLCLAVEDRFLEDV